MTYVLLGLLIEKSTSLDFVVISNLSSVIRKNLLNQELSRKDKMYNIELIRNKMVYFDR